MVKSDKPLSNVEIDQMYQLDNHYKGVQYIFDLKDITEMKDKDYMILAIDVDPADGVIAHFVAMHRDGDTLNYFNSYGIDTPIQVLKYAKRSGIKKIASNDSLYQTDSNLCGYFSCYVIDRLNKGDKFEDIVNVFHVHPRNYLNRDILAEHFNTWEYHNPTKITEGGDLLSKVDNLVGGMPEMHLWKGTKWVHSFTGPFTHLKDRLNPDGSWKSWSKPVDRVDLASYHHDLKYEKTTDTAERNRADGEMLAELKAIPNPTVRERIERAVVAPIIGTKKLVGLGV